MHKFNPDNALRLERPERYQLLPPQETLHRFGVRNGMTVVDIGAGTGFFARAAAELTGPAGRVYAVDMSPEMIAYLKASAIPAHLNTVLSEEYTIPLPDGTADLTVLAFVVHETPDILRFLDEARRITRADGHMVILDWKMQEEEHGPPADERLDEQVLLQTLSPRFGIKEHGSLNASHYYVVVQFLRP